MRQPQALAARAITQAIVDEGQEEVTGVGNVSFKLHFHTRFFSYAAEEDLR